MLCSKKYYYVHKVKVNGHEWDEGIVPEVHWVMGEFLPLILRCRNVSKCLNLAVENCHGISLCIQCSRIFDFGMDSLLHLVGELCTT